MSRITVFLASLLAVVARLGIAHMTRETYERTMKKFVRVMFELGYTHMTSPRDIAGRHMRAYSKVRRGEKMNVRTIQNEMAHIRCVLKATGHCGVASAPELKNKELGIGGGSRLGSKKAMTQEKLDGAVARALRLKRPGIAALLLLQWNVGLRGNESLHARSDTLDRWEKELHESGRLNVYAGTKGGRQRLVTIRNVEAASAAIQLAIKVAATQGGFLIVRANGSPAGGLEQARNIYQSWCKRAKITAHSNRYTFVQQQVCGYMDAGHSAREAGIATSLDVGHGSGRGRWVKSVYMPR